MWPFSSPWLWGTHTSQFICVSPDLVLARTAEQEPGLTLPAGRDPVQSQNPVSCVTVTVNSSFWTFAGQILSIGSG